jgi:hypothetical protein
MLEGIQSDITAKVAYNGYTQRLVAAIKQDIENDPKFDFSKWITDPSKPCLAFEQCKEEFEFKV